MICFPRKRFPVLPHNLIPQQTSVSNFLAGSSSSHFFAWSVQVGRRNGEVMGTTLRVALVIFSVINLVQESAAHDIEAAPIVQVEGGLLRGTTAVSRAGRPYYAFTGIRYAEPVERFKLPEPVQPWEGIRNATDHGNVCPQILGGGVLTGFGGQGKEDCLFLSVYAPKRNPSETSPLPVMVWIHGGIFVFGSENEFNAKYLMDEDIVLVAINYRLGALGFLYLEDESIPGNLGLLDQLEALWWVQINIQDFGGNPNLVTIFGQSAGGASVHLHTISPQSRGLFHRAIAQSGSALAPWVISPYPRQQALTFAGKLGCNDGHNSSAEIVECLRDVEVARILEEQSELMWATIFKYQFSPVVEKGAHINSSIAFLPEHPQTLLEKKKIVNPVPYLTGTVANEAAIFVGGLVAIENLGTEDVFRDLNSKWNDLAPGLLYYYFTNQEKMSPQVHEVSDKIRKFYFGDLPLNLSTEQRLSDAMSDRFFGVSIVDAARAHSKVAPTFAYKWTFKGSFSMPHLFDYFHHTPPAHSDDLPYLFELYIKFMPDTKEEEEFSKKIVKLWVSFAKTGKPEATWGIAGHWWPMVNASDERFTYYKIDKSPQLLADYDEHERFKLWRNVLDPFGRVRPAKKKCRRKKAPSKSLLHVATTF